MKKKKQLSAYLKVIQRSCKAETFGRAAFRGTDSTHTPKPRAL